MSRLNRYYLAPDLVITYPDGQPHLHLYTSNLKF
ncbi:hypothetical protein HNQ84_002764 [Anoxybacillus eryuanensis]